MSLSSYLQQNNPRLFNLPGPTNPPVSPSYSGSFVPGGPPAVDTGSQGVTTPLGAGQGPGTQGTGQSSDNPFQNSFFFQIPQPSGSIGTPSTGSVANTSPPGGSSWGQYVPLIIVGVITAGIAYYAFQRRSR